MKAKTYGFRQGSHLDKRRAKEVGRHLEKLAGGRGELTAEVVVISASKEGSPLHDFFEWDDGLAAASYRLEQARHLIRCVVVFYETESTEGEPVEYRAFYNVDSEKTDAPYVTMTRVMSDADLRASLLAKALKEATSWQDRYKTLVELAAVFVEIGKVRRTTKGRKGKVA